MKLTADRRALHAAFQHVGSIVTSAIARPIYQNVKLDAKGADLFLSATDLEIGLCIKASKVQVEQEGSVLVPEARVTPILGATPDETVSIAGDESGITIETADSKFRVLGEAPAEFGDIPSLQGDAAIEIDPDVLQYMVRRTTFAAADERGRYALNGVLLVVDEQGSIELAAADGARLANVRKKVSNPGKTKIDCIVMKKGLEHAARLASLSEKPLRVQVTQTQFLAENDIGRMCCQLVEGQFPNYREVIPRDCKIKIELPTKAFLNALMRAALLASEQTRAVDFTFSAGLLTLSSHSPDLGEAEVRLPVEYKGEKAQVAFNPQYIEDMLKVVERETMKMEFNDSRSPCVLRSGVDYVYVVSPVVREEVET
jgi:DNA polymerase-3 subunit beta